MEIRLLGLVEASHDGHVLPLGGAKPRALLAILALQANAPVSADRLIEGLWGEEPPATAPKLVQVLVSQLRKQLADADAEIVTRGRGYELRMDPDAVDALLFERLLASGENGTHVREALALWRGPPLDDLADEPFAAPEIRRLEDLWLHARELAIDAALADGRHEAVLGELDELVREHPLRERLHGQRMLALYRCGRQADALEGFRHARQVLMEEVGLEPGPELRRLNDSMLRQDPELDGPPAPARSFAGPRRRRSRWLLVAAGMAAVAVAVLVVTQLGGSDGLDGISEDAVAAIDPGNGQILAPQYSVGHAPDAAAAGAGSVWTANGRDGTVSRVDRGRGQVTTIEVDGEPTAVAFGSGSLWVADGQNGRVDQIDSRTNRVVRKLPAGNSPRGVAVAGGAVWLASAVDGQVERLDLATGRIQQIDVPGGPAAIAAGGGAVWVAGEQGGVVTKLDPRSGAALRGFPVGNAPSGIAVGYGAVWVTNRDDGTVTRIDTATEVGETVPVGGEPVAVAAGLGSIWVADGAQDAVIRIDPRTRKASRIAVRSAPSALTIAGGSVWAAAIASRASHRGGTLRYASPPFDVCNCIDPAGYDPNNWPMLSLTYDGLVAYRRIAGAGGSTLVADLAASVPQPADGGRTFTFQLRPGRRFSDGTPVRPADFRTSIERAFRVASPVARYFYGGITGAGACSRRRCDLSKGIETDAASRAITIHLARPDTEFAQKLALPMAYVLPARTPARLIRERPAPGTGPYVISAYSPASGLRLVRNVRFRSWSAEARPDGFPDAITIAFSNDPAALVAAVQHGRADAVVTAGDTQLPIDQARALVLASPNRVHTGPVPATTYLFLNVRERPFDDLRVRRALNYAIDRRRVVGLAGGSAAAGVSCQVLPPGLPGYKPTCRFTLGATPAGNWSAPDLARARRLVAASGTGGARVTVQGPPKYAAVARYAGSVLRRLGYRVQVRVFPEVGAYFDYVSDPRHRVQVGIYSWGLDILTPASFFETFSCKSFAGGLSGTPNPSRFCDRAVDAGYRAALAAHGTEANARWAALDRRLLAAAPLAPLFSRRTVLLVSGRVGNVQLHQQLGPLLDQFWVH